MQALTITLSDKFSAPNTDTRRRFNGECGLSFQPQTVLRQNNHDVSYYLTRFPPSPAEYFPRVCTVAVPVNRRRLTSNAHTKPRLTYIIVSDNKRIIITDACDGSSTRNRGFVSRQKMHKSSTRLNRHYFGISSEPNHTRAYRRTVSDTWFNALLIISHRCCGGASETVIY